VIVGARREPELSEDASNVLLDRALGDEESVIRRALVEGPSAEERERAAS
jgi:hypothetical protein